MEILNAVAHKVNKDRGVKGASLAEAKGELARTDELNSLMLTLLDSYNNRSSRFAGSFEEDEDNYRFSVHLRDHLDGKTSFIDFSIHAGRRLVVSMNDVIFAGGGYMLLLRYTHQQRDMLMVAKLNPQSGAIFSDDLDKVVRAPYLNLDRLQVAARIDLAAWLAGGQRYLSFVLKKNKDDGPSDYFEDFVGCKVDQDSKVESKKLVLVVKDFASSLVDAEAMPAGDVPDLQRRAFDYVESLRKSDSPRLDDFEGLANAIWPDEPTAFLHFLNGHESAPSAGFLPDATSIKALSDINYKSKELSLKMTYTFKQGHVHLDGTTVIIKQAPEKLIQELNES
ncbi:nucleoid-associated protein [Stenotrophomonas sp. CD2]|nr:nucleoid-associated protein [Stenotrophomonas sp. CD2]